MGTTFQLRCLDCKEYIELGKMRRVPSYERWEKLVEFLYDHEEHSLDFVSEYEWSWDPRSPDAFKCKYSPYEKMEAK
jgi:hypothetical protein